MLVVDVGEGFEVYKGGSLIGTFGRDDPGMRNVLLLSLLRDKKVRKGRLAKAFKVDTETLWRVRLRFDAGGLGAIVEQNPGGPKRVRTKKTLANLFAAPGTVRLRKTSIRLTLQPPATTSERAAFTVLFAEVNALGLTLSGDPSRRRLRFQLHTH